MPEQDIARYKHIFEEILRMTDDGFIVIDTNGIVTDINDQYCDFLGKPKEEIVGYSIQKTISNSKMVDIVNRRYSEELALHKFLPGESKENDNNFLLVSRSCVCDDQDRVVAGVAQVKFRLQTLDSAKRLMSEYAELEFYKEEYHKAGSFRASFDSIVGSTEVFLEKKRLGIKAARTDFPVLLTGETGTGKEVFARSIHNASSRADKPMVSINCAAIPNELLESELFGYVDGAFTGARKGGKPGKFQLANGGTLFLDEIGDMPLNMQAKILRALQEREVEPVGGSGPVSVDVRVISATRRNLPALIEAGEFREDLYYRLNVINIEMPPLRCRRADILELANHFLACLNKEFQRTTVLSQEVKQCFASYQWPGNIRELDNVIKGAYATCDGFTIDMRDLPGKMSLPRQPSVPDTRSGKQLTELMNDYEREIILAVLRDKGATASGRRRSWESTAAPSTKRWPSWVFIPPPTAGAGSTDPRWETIFLAPSERSLYTGEKTREAAHMARIDKENYYLDIADTVLKRSTCLRRCYGAIIVKNDEILSTGYNGAPRGRKNCTDLGRCTREELRVPSGERYELCRSVHAEANCIISAPRSAALGSTMYLAGRDAKTGALLPDATSCSMCRRLIINAGIQRVVIRRTPEQYAVVHVEDWIREDDSLPREAEEAGEEGCSCCR